MQSRLKPRLAVTMAVTVLLAGLAGPPAGASQATPASSPPPTGTAEPGPPPGSYIGDPNSPQPPEAAPSSDRENREYGARRGIFTGTEASSMLSANPQTLAIPSMTVEECRNNDRGDEEEYAGWVKDHASYCQWNRVKLKYYDPRGRYLGELKFRFTMRGWAWQADDPASGRRVDFGITFDEWSADPGILKERFAVAMICQGWPDRARSCRRAAPLQVARTVSQWISGEPEILFAFDSPNSRQSTTDRERRATGAFQAIFIPGIPGPWTEPARTWPNTVRFDSAWYLKNNRIPDSRRYGTIFDRVMPFLRFRTSDPNVAEEARHIWNAQNKAEERTFPKWDGKTVPGKWPGADWKPGTTGDYLNRIYRPTEDPTLGRKNHAQAVRTCVAQWGENYTTGPNGERRHCDEYPFASTYQGAAKGDNRYSACPIDADHNEAGGRALGNWYSYDRIIHNDYFTIDAVDDSDETPAAAEDCASG